MKRFDCLKAIAGKVGDALVVGSAGGATVEWYHLHPSEGNFRSRTLGLASSIGLGIALSLPQRKVIVLDGDGSLLINLCGLPTAAWAAPPNLIHIVFDNQVYEFLRFEPDGDGRADRPCRGRESRRLSARTLGRGCRRLCQCRGGCTLRARAHFHWGEGRARNRSRNPVADHGRHREQIPLHAAYREARGA